MHVVNPHWVSGTRRRCQAIAVLISLQLCLISSVEANHLTVGELGSPDTGTVEPTWRRQWWTSHLFPLFIWGTSAEQRMLHFKQRSVKRTSCWELPDVTLPLRFTYFMMKCNSGVSSQLPWATDFLHFPEFKNNQYPRTCSSSCRLWCAVWGWWEASFFQVVWWWRRSPAEVH